MCAPRPKAPPPPPPPPPAPVPAEQVNRAEIKRRELAPKAPQTRKEVSQTDPTVATQKRRRGKAALRIPLQQSYLGGGTGVNIV